MLAALEGFFRVGRKVAVRLHPLHVANVALDNSVQHVGCQRDVSGSKGLHQEAVLAPRYFSQAFDVCRVDCKGLFTEYILPGFEAHHDVLIVM